MLTQLKQVHEFKEIPVLMLAAVLDQNNVLHIVCLGARDYLAKPFHEARLLEKVFQLDSFRKKTAMALDI